ncbi:MAG: GDP-mannose 4,6-dehydratase [Candidatus Thermoplasmatota archaeon]
MKYLVTGGAGFIGSNLVDTLMLEHPEKIVVIDNLRTGKKDFIKDHLTKKNFTFLKNDIKRVQSFPNETFDWVFHLAANADIRGGIHNTKVDLEENVIGTHCVLEFMRKHDCKKLVFASSSALYGETTVLPTPENVPDIKPISFYGASKIAAEHFISSYCSTYGMQSWMFRFANVVGKRCTHGVIPDFVAKLKKNPRELEILGDGNQTKSYFDVSDCVAGLINIPRVDTWVVAEAYNLANTETIQVKDLAPIVVDEMGLKNVKYRFTGGDRGWIGDVPVTILSFEKAKKAGWRTTLSLEQTVRRTVRYLLDGV